MDAARARPTFDVICAGDATWTFRRRGLAHLADVFRRSQPGGGAVKAALSLASRGVRVGLATVLVDDRAGRALLGRLDAAGIATEGVRFTVPTRSGLLWLESDVDVAQELDEPVAVPEGWSAPVLLLSGVSPAVSHGAALMREARRARRAGSTVILDVSAKWHVWAGQDGRMLRSLLREVDVVRCTAVDLSVLGMPPAEVRETLRPGAVLVTTEPTGETRVNGPFGELSVPPSSRTRRVPDADETTAAICAELVRVTATEVPELPFWERALG